jgi:hypothetical protein
MEEANNKGMEILGNVCLLQVRHPGHNKFTFICPLEHPMMCLLHLIPSSILNLNCQDVKLIIIKKPCNSTTEPQSKTITTVINTPPAHAAVHSPSVVPDS